MAVDYVIHLECPPKLHFGEGDAFAGTNTLMSLVKARNRADLLAEMAARDGKRPEEMNVVLRTVGPGGDAEAREVTWTELAAAAAPLASQEEHCRACPANFLEHAFGCYGATNYPVPRVAEEWLMSRLQLADQVGGFLCLRMIADFGYDGAPIQNMRRTGLFEASAPVSKVLQKGFLSKKSVDPQLDGFAERSARTRLELGPPSDDPGIAGMQRLLAGLYAAFLNNAPTLVWP